MSLLLAFMDIRDQSVFIGVPTRGFLGWIIVGLLAGWIAGHLTRGRGFGCVADIVLGLIGAVIGGWIFTRLGITTFGFWGSLAAATLGAGPLVTLLRITLPSIRWGIAYGVTLTTDRVLGEFGAVSLISGNRQGQTETLTLYVANQFSSYNLVGAYMGGLLLAVISLIVLGLLSLSKRKEQRSWRSKSAASQNDSVTQSP